MALATSVPNRAQSCFEAPVAIISIAQQEVPKTSGHSELALDQLIIVSIEVTTIFPPFPAAITSPGKSFGSSGFCSGVGKFGLSIPILVRFSSKHK